MGLPAGLDPDLLRAFAFIAEEGSFTRAAERIGRTQSAVSMQVQRLEATLGQKVLLRGKGGAVQLTPHGHYLLERSRELLALNDEIWSTFRAPQMHGTVRLGTPDDYALRYLPQVLRRFADSHPAIEVEVLCAPSSELVERLREGDLDLSLVTEGHGPRNWPEVELWRGPLRWITSDRHAPHKLDPLPLALAAQGCAWRRTALRALEGTGRRARIAYTSATLAGTTAPVLAGLAVTVSTIAWLPEGLRPLRPDEGLPQLPDTGILLLKGRTPRQPVTDVLAAHISDTFQQEMRWQDRLSA
ncbi:LysR substrate-binding domain-containing protein [Limobrevibacterium gyesilva]|uniref:LysR substrate-binding domain-containing protein n=1 Tax=Limobrevibacterium gyesilva TaxID=2991712 RepID=A0AA42CFN0_9PROT|nr:LysR substrate-binding domain-containing protein [Limobrevibacterium gyesilva]MCW3473162.1 LysR substrate-binding domain-containing protein [Limobrevibacterium gyesilva]